MAGKESRVVGLDEVMEHKSLGWDFHRGDDMSPYNLVIFRSCLNMKPGVGRYKP